VLTKKWCPANIHVTGKAGLGGDLAAALSLSGKNIDARISAAMNVNASLDTQWCPVIKIAPVGRWVDSASVEVVGRNCAGFDLGPLGHPELCAAEDSVGDTVTEGDRDAVSSLEQQGSVTEDGFAFAIKVHHTLTGASGSRPRTRSAAFSAIMITGALMLPPTKSGITGASTTRGRSIRTSEHP
jgi:hypothetical protein